MTCVATTTWNSFSPAGVWYSMNPDPSDSSNAGHERATSHGYASSESEARRSGSSKKRASRAGTRSVSTLSTAQLERKRANDREAQRAIRQRTKDHIDGLERNITELRQSHDASEQVVAVIRQRNRELEEENSYLRLRMSEAGLPVSLPPTDTRVPESGRLAAHTPSPLTQPTAIGVARSASASTAQSFSNSNVPPSGPPPPGWQHQHPGYGSSLSHPLSGPAVSPSTAGANLSTWRAHEMAQSIPQAVAGDARLPPQQHSPLPYGAPPHTDRLQWHAQPAQYQHTVSEGQPPTSQYHPVGYPSATQQPAVQQQQPYGQQPVHVYPSRPHPQQQSGYPPTQAPPQAEFQNLAVSSPAQYHLPPSSQSFAPPGQYHMAPPNQQHGDYTQVPAPQLPAAPYQGAPDEQAYQHPPGPYREEPPRGYNHNMGQYPPG
ncbi:hypothetical protein LTR95_009626 [Oleoguttula sp. CCFEE 5521]